MNDTECLFYKKFKDYSMKMFMGDTKNYFVTSMPCDVPLSPLLDGKPFTPLLKQSQIDDEMRVNKSKALREYYNQPMAESEDQMIRNANIIRNSIFLLPILQNTTGKEIFILAADTSRSGDNSIFGAMRVVEDENVGLYGEIVNCMNLVDITKKRKMSMKIPDQVQIFYQNILAFNGVGNPDYSQIEGFLMDSGAGGQPNGFADLMLDDWQDQKGNSHKGFIDDTHDLYKEDSNKYPNASRIFNLVNPQKWRHQMCEELLELMNLDLIKFPKEYDNKGYVVQETETENGIELSNRTLSFEEEVALANIDAMKSELLAIHKFYDANGNIIRYANPDQHAKDDRFYVLLLLAHKLYELRRKHIVNKKQDETELLQFVKNIASLSKNTRNTLTNKIFR